jgi:hypothetical protein
MDDVQQNFERWVADRFFDWYSATGGLTFEFSRRAGEAPDLVYSCGRNELFVEITAAYCDGDHAKFLWEYARGVPNPPVGWFGVGSPHKALIQAVVDRISAKCKKSYGGLTLLLIEIPPGHTTAENLTELLVESVFPEVIPFVGVYVTGRFPMTSTSMGGYRVLPIKALPAGAFVIVS